MTDRSSDGRARWCAVLAFTSLALGLYAAKLWVIASYGNATPFWDQWDAEADKLYVPYRLGTLHLAALVAPHNEHRLLTTRLLALALFVANGIWNPLLQMVVSAGVHVAGIVLGLVGLWRGAGRRFLAALVLFGAAVFAVPFGWENALQGFQVSFYFLFVFSIGGLWWLTASRPLDRRWWAGVVLAVLAFLSLASGVVACGAALLVMLAQYVSGTARDKRQAIAVLVLFVLVLAGIGLTPRVPGTETLRPHGLADAYRAMLDILSWPAPGSLLAALARNAPAIAYVAYVMRTRPRRADPAWFIVGSVFWLGGQALTLTYGRAAVVLSSRYLDIASVALPVNFVCLLVLVSDIGRATSSPMRRLAALGCVGVWTTLFLVAGARTAMKGLDHQPSPGGLAQQLDFKRASDRAGELNTQEFLRTGDRRVLERTRFVPYPDPQKLAAWLESPDVRAILPANLQQPMMPLSSGRFDRVVIVLLANAGSVLALAVVAGVLAAVVGSGSELS